jgi:hypothetical protein
VVHATHFAFYFSKWETGVLIDHPKQNFSDIETSLEHERIPQNCSE